MGPNDAADSVTAAQGGVMIRLAPFAQHQYDDGPHFLLA